MVRIAVALVTCSIGSSALQAQVQPRKWPVSMLEANCRAGQAGRNMNPDYCNRTTAVARSRYGGDVTLYQWNSAVEVVRNQIRQGK
jgi:hypothetical protein